MAGLIILVLLVAALIFGRAHAPGQDQDQIYREQKIKECAAKGGIERLHPRSSVPLGCDLPLLK
jgi:hypothetical protein